MEPWEIMISESQERMVAAVRPESPGGGRGGVRALGAAPRGDRRRHRQRAVLRALWRRRAGRRDPRLVPHRRVPALRGRAAAARPRRPAAAPRRVEPEATLGLRAVRPARRLAHRAPAGPRRRRAAAAAVASRPRRLARGPPRRASATRSAPARWPCSAPRATSRAPAASRSALTDCLNFGNPEKPEIAWELAQAIEGIAQAAEALGIPVVSGNVSLYNETDGRAIPPTPVVGCVGLVPDVRSIPRAGSEGDAVAARDRAATASSTSQPRPRCPLPLDGRAAAHARARRRSTAASRRARGGGAWSGVDADVELPPSRAAAPRSSPARPGTSSGSARRGLTRIGIVS